MFSHASIMCKKTYCADVFSKSFSSFDQNWIEMTKNLQLKTFPQNFFFSKFFKSVYSEISVTSKNVSLWSSISSIYSIRLSTSIRKRLQIMIVISQNGYIKLKQPQIAHCDLEIKALHGHKNLNFMLNSFRTKVTSHLTSLFLWNFEEFWVVLFDYRSFLVHFCR